jgi:hypothetical protein
MDASKITLEDVKRLRLEPGDHLVIRVTRGTSFEALEHMQELLMARFGDRVTVMTDDCDMTVVSGLEPDRGLTKKTVLAAPERPARA